MAKLLKKAWDYFSKPRLRISPAVIPFGHGIERKDPYSLQWRLFKTFSSRRDAEKFIGIIKPDVELDTAEFF